MLTCPYQSFAKPVISFCEPNVCAFIAQPANAWSNLAYVAVGLVLLIYGLRRKDKCSTWLPVIIIMIGTFSFLYHASFTFVGQMFDLGSMFLLSSYLIIFNLRRINPAVFTGKKSLFIFILLNLVSLALMYIIRVIDGFNIGLVIFAVQVAVILWLEFYLIRKSNYALRVTNLLTALLIMATACVIWMLDYTKTWCSTNSFHLVNGHAIWHVLTAIGLIFVYNHYQQYAKNNSRLNLAAAPGSSQ